jgi:hypothetical protein
MAAFGRRWGIAQDGRPSYAANVMEFLDGKVVRETADPFEPGPPGDIWLSERDDLANKSFGFERTVSRFDIRSASAASRFGKRINAIVIDLARWS